MTILKITHVYWRGPGWYAFEESPPNKVRIFPVADEAYGLKRGFRVERLGDAPQGRGVIRHNENTLVMG